MNALCGRRDERAALGRLLAGVRAGKSAALVLRGEPGVGKTALLRHAVDSASGLRVARTAGVESELAMAFAALHRLCAPMLDKLDRIPEPQREALRTAFGQRDGSAPDRFLVGLAALSLLSETAAEAPLLCVVDDAQWLDRESAQALAFVGRRLLAEPIGMLFATREETEELRGLPELAVEGLDGAGARELLESVMRGPLDLRVRDRIVAETRGNPLALLELAGGRTAAELAGGFDLPARGELAGRIEESFARRLAALPPATRTLLLVAAAEPLGDPMLVWRAAVRLGIDFDAAQPATDAGLAEFGAGVRFEHPLARSAVYNAASAEERRRVHEALAEATDPEVDPDRRAWHRAYAACGADEDVAEELERSAGRALARGGVAAAAAFRERAATLTPDAGRRARRSLDAARAKHRAGAFDTALALVGAAEAAPLDQLDHAQAELLRAQIAFALDRSGDAPVLLLEAARRLEPLDARLARETYLDAFAATLFAGADVRDVAVAARAAPSAGDSPRAADLLLDGMSLAVTAGYVVAAPVLRSAVSALRHASRDEQIRWLWLGCRAAVSLWDDEAWDALSALHLEIVRGAGVLSELPVALSTRIAVLANLGDPSGAASLADEQRAVSEAMGSHLMSYGALLISAWQGDERTFTELAVPAARTAVTGWWRTVLFNGLGRFEEALQAGGAGEPERVFSTWVLPELVEAAALSGDVGRAADALERFTSVAQAGGTEWALGMLARSRALVAGDEAFFLEAVERLGRTRMRAQLARAHLLYGESLRGDSSRRADAREQLRTAFALLSEMGIEAFAARAERELLRAGESAPRRARRAGGELTAQEAHIARLASDGLSNPEIGARLFISPRTVEYHLHKVFTKLGIRSRGELSHAAR